MVEPVNFNNIYNICNICSSKLQNFHNLQDEHVYIFFKDSLTKSFWKPPPPPLILSAITETSSLRFAFVPDGTNHPRHCGLERESEHWNLPALLREICRKNISPLWKKHLVLTGECGRAGVGHEQRPQQCWRKTRNLWEFCIAVQLCFGVFMWANMREKYSYHLSYHRH